MQSPSCLSPVAIPACLQLGFALLFAISTAFGGRSVQAADVPERVAGIPVNYDESAVGSYSLPDPLRTLDGQAVTTPEMWMHHRRQEVLQLFEQEQFGSAPDRSEVSFEVFEAGTPVFEGQAIRSQVTVYFTKARDDHKADLVLYLPVAPEAGSAAPLLLHISFFPNSLTVADEGIRKGMLWNREGVRVSEPGNWSPNPIEVRQFIEAGLGFATVYYGDIDPDFPKGLLYGVRGYYLDVKQAYPADSEWGAIAAWSWGLSAVMDYLQTAPGVDASKVAVTGFSRLGKTALWAGASDSRFAMVIPCLSGEGGAALSRRNFGETIAHMIAPDRFFYQFCANRAKYAQDPSSCPVDANLLLALVAPRPLLLITGSTDHWSDAKGEFLSAVAAEPVYQLLGKQGLSTDVLPEPGFPILHDIGFLMHEGGHTVLPQDWELMITFMQQHFFNPAVELQK